MPSAMPRWSRYRAALHYSAPEHHAVGHVLELGPLGAAVLEADRVPHLYEAITTYLVMACMFMAHVVMAYVVVGLCSYGLCGYGPM